MTAMPSTEAAPQPPAPNRAQRRAQKHSRAHFKSPAERRQYRSRCRTLARQLVIHGKRLSGTDDDFEGGIRRPLTMSENDAMLAYNWAINTPNRWWCRAWALFRADDGTEYIEEREHEVDQQVLANELSAERRGLMQQARDGGNPRHLVAEGYEVGIL
ncbi:hypothetical protein PRZ61_10610 [Halomonas pacifica]|uniref:hypothetical protein n=1 Tax=Bisbaumannia pacifica TaxID=77098 RepID=UPI00235842D5|nr:hypothetical protein [Halomonas pacifica]MDC8803886.1 hypothetical protein [Halomonas pacifica]